MSETKTLTPLATEDGRTIITDRPATLAGERGEWIGRKPR